MPNYWFKNVKIFTIGWLIGLFIWRFIRNAGIRNYMQSLHIKFSFLNVLLFILVISLLAGIIFGTIQYYNEHFSKIKISFRLQLLKALAIHLAVMLILYLLIYLIIDFSKINSIGAFKDFIINPVVAATLFYSLLINACIIFIIHLNKILGKSNLTKLITGSFYTPKEEYRAFMFLDLQSSTEIGENLGHIKYSELIQDCFHDLLIIEKTKAEIYQYVGDEAVLTWKLNNNNKLNNCLQAFYLFKEKLLSKKEYYINKYGIYPKFTAGLHLGPVTVTEVGSLKREIAYHGDTLNVASRIQGKCKELKKEFLVSEKVINNFGNHSEFNFEKLEAYTLRGKKGKTLLYAVSAIPV